MKIIVNKTQSTVVLASGRIVLAPEGMPNDRKEITDEVAALADVQRFAGALKKVSLLSLEASAQRDAKASAKAPKAKVDANADAKAKAEADAKDEGAEDDGNETSSKKKKKRKN